MKRRKFLSYLAKSAAVSPILINGLPMKAIGSSPMFKRLTSDPFENRKLILIQLHGGNDGLNNLIPMEQYADYQSSRANIAIPDSGPRSYIPLDNTLPIPDQVGLHPDMLALKDMYDSGKVNIVQGVGYENTNQSHFRSRDIWFMGSDYNEYKRSGWMGRYLDHIYPDYPDAYPTAEMPDPLGLEIGSQVSLGFYREMGIPAALATNDPENFADIIAGLGGPPPDVIPDNYFGQELQHIIDLYANANDYAQQLQTRFNSGTNYVQYPMGNILPYPGPVIDPYIQNPLGWQLQTVARLIHGGCKTRIYLVRIGGFDTHDNQVNNGDTTHGIHAALLFHFSNALKAFSDDMAASGYDEEVMAMTFSDFGRRPHDNGSFGTDHGTSAPVYIFGKGVEPGVTGTNPDLVNLDPTGNLLVQHDYRQVITTLLCDWMGADSDAITAAEFEDFIDMKLPLIDPAYSDPTTAVNSVIAPAFSANVFPNPVRSEINISVYAPESTEATLSIFDTLGRMLLSREVSLVSGNNSFSEDVNHFGRGTYFLSIRSKPDQKVLATKQIMKQ